MYETNQQSICPFCDMIDSCMRWWINHLYVILVVQTFIIRDKRTIYKSIWWHKKLMYIRDNQQSIRHSGDTINPRWTNELYIILIIQTFTIGDDEWSTSPLDDTNDRCTRKIDNNYVTLVIRFNIVQDASMIYVTLMVMIEPCTRQINYLHATLVIRLNVVRDESMFFLSNLWHK